jgi:hypothetical protein
VQAGAERRPGSVEGKRESRIQVYTGACLPAPDRGDGARKPA